MSVCHISQHSHWDTQASPRHSSLSILAIFKETSKWNIHFGVFCNRVIFGNDFWLFQAMSDLLFFSKCSHRKMQPIHVHSFIEKEIKRTAEIEKERVTGRKAIQHKGLWRSLTFLYVRIESLYMVLPGTLPIQDCSIKVLTTVCISSNNSPERQVKYIQSNQPFAKAPQKHTFQHCCLI